MTKEEYEIIKSLKNKEDFITVSDIEEISDGLGERTLLYGYTSSKFVWHVYYKSNLIHKLIYACREIVSHKSYISVDPKILIPSKHLLPEACDFSFCSLLSALGIGLPFANFNEAKTKKIFYGMTI